MCASAWEGTWHDLDDYWRDDADSVFQPLPVSGAAVADSLESRGQGVPGLCSAGNADGDLRADHLRQGSRARLEPEQPIPVGRVVRHRSDALATQRIAQCRVECRVVLSVSLVALSCAAAREVKGPLTATPSLTTYQHANRPSARSGAGTALPMTDMT